MTTENKWHVRQADTVLQHIFSRELKVSPLMSKLLINRNIYTVKDAREFISGDLSHLHSPFLMTGMETGVDRVLDAVKNREKILVYGDYDADGITATALLLQALKKIGAEADYYIPGRLTDGYGLHQEALKRAREAGFKLVITVDCGINAVDEVEWALAQGGPDIVITDHHEAPSILPRALAVINPRRHDCSYPFKELAGVGVALKLAQALLEHHARDTESWQQLLDFVCIGTVADIMPLWGENRILVKYGLEVLMNTQNSGLRTLMTRAGIKQDRMGTREVSFMLAPRLNAAGRIGDAGQAVELLLCEDMNESLERANLLDKGNQERQKIESRVFTEARDLLERELGLGDYPVIVLAAPGWHLGVIGIVASRLVERLNKPVLMIALEDGIGKGSARSIPGFNIYEALTRCEDCLTNYGGHAGAAGFSVPADRVEELRQRLKEASEELEFDGFMAAGTELDAITGLDEITEDLVRELSLLEPHGHQNPEPLLGCSGAEVLNSRGVGKQGTHLKLTLRQNNEQGVCTTLPGIAFNKGDRAGELGPGTRVDMVFTPDLNLWNGHTSLQLKIKDIAPADREYLKSIEEVAACAAADPISDLLRESEGVVSENEHMFIPDYVLCRLSQCSCLTFQGNDPMDLENAMCTYPDPGLQSGVNEINKYHADLTALLREKGRKIITVIYPRQTIELALYLQRIKEYPKAAFLHRYMSAGNKKAVIQMYNTGHVDTIITNPSLIPLLSDHGFDHIGLYHMPFDRVEWNCISGAAINGGLDKIYLIYKNDPSRHDAALQAMAPQRESLALLYNILKKMAPRQFNPDRAVNSLRASGMERAGLHTLLLGLQIFKEIDLLEYHWQEDKIKISLNAAKGVKANLSDSPTYCKLQDMVVECRNWQYQIAAKSHN